MTLLEILEKFKENMSNIELSQRMTKDFYRKHFAQLANSKKICQENEYDEAYTKSMHNMFFTDPRNQKHVLYGSKTLSFDEQITQSVLKKNREYQFLLMEAYEVFEDAIEETYAYLGENDVNFWTLCEYGNITYDKIAKQDFSFYLECAEKRKYGAIGIVKMLIDKFNCNIQYDNLDLKTCIILIGKIRHHIVHAGGIIKNKDEFIFNCAKPCQKCSNDTIDENFHNYISVFIGESNSQNLINLTEERALPKFPIVFERCRFGNLLNHLLLCVHVLYEESKKHIENLPQTTNNIK